MRTFTRSKALTVVTVGLIAAGSGIGYADDVSNALDGSIDAVAEIMPLNVGGSSGTTTLYISPTNGDGKNGCNLTGSTTLTVSLASNNPAVATVSPSSATFTSCGDTKTITVTPVAEGTATVSATQTSNNTGGSFNFAPATFTVNVARPAPANTAPNIAVAGLTGGALYSKGAVPAAVCQVTDAEDGTSSHAATLSEITGPYAADGIGSQTANCSYTDRGGLTVSASETYGIIDGSAPVITHTLNPATPNGSNGWYNSGDVVLDWTVTEDDSPNSLVLTGCEDRTISSDQPASEYTCAATSAGGSSGPQTVTIQRDGLAPTVSYTSAQGTLGNNDWYTASVTATFTATDALSGPASATDTATSSGEGSAVRVDSPAFTDNAGNTTVAGAASHTFKIDLSNPSASFDNTIGSVYFGSVPTAPTCSASDDVSGPSSCVVSGWSNQVGLHTLTATATDNAGRTAIAEQVYTVKSWTLGGFYSPVDMGGVWNTVKGGSTVPLKLEVFAGATELTSTTAVGAIFSARPITCPNGAVTTDQIEITSTGGTSFRYDATGGQFIQNWATPKKPGACYAVTMTTADGSATTANFMLK